MRVVIAGGHGRVARRVGVRLAESGMLGVGLVRRPGHVDDIRQAGGEAVLVDLATASVSEVADALADADVVVYTAGAGPEGTVEQIEKVDLGGSLLVAEAAEQAGVRGFLQLSTVTVAQPVAADADRRWKSFVAAKKAAEEDLRGRQLEWVILRAGTLSDDRGTGKVSLTTEVGTVGNGTVPRRDVAAVILALLAQHDLHHLTLEVGSGDTRVDHAVAALASDHLDRQGESN